LDRFEVGELEPCGVGEPVDNVCRSEHVRAGFRAGHLDACRRTHGFPADIRTDRPSINVPDFGSGNFRIQVGCHSALEDFRELLLA